MEFKSLFHYTIQNKPQKKALTFINIAVFKRLSLIITQFIGKIKEITPKPPFVKTKVLLHLYIGRCLMIPEYVLKSKKKRFKKRTYKRK
jgi:hypothetical protein